MVVTEQMYRAWVEATDDFLRAEQMYDEELQYSTEEFEEIEYLYWSAKDAIEVIEADLGPDIVEEFLERLFKEN